MNIKVAFFDVDGTIVDNHSKQNQSSDMELVPQSTIEALRLLKEKGNHPFIATGRSPFMIESLLEGLSIDSYICTNGQYAVMHNQVMYEAPYKKELLDRIVEIASQNNVPLLWMPKTHYILSGEHQEFLLEALKNMNLPEPLIETGMKSTNDKIYQMVAGVTVENEHIFYPLEEVRVVRWQPKGVDLLPRTGSKATAILAILEKLGLGPEQAIAFGDGLNDIEMLQAVGCGVAMGNAHEELKKHADYVTKPVSEDGIYYACKELGLI